ncbi:phosphatase [Jiella sp. MQZ9-1]|uniref:Phosphatase n=1 Tax=Jiella flava TaxID=2816857 RepID=A0A939FUC2_9HYPH|nr:phosphatase [Jiella flava]MBO0661590.1 phosphatase [Jiella flava]MCD2470232.1 phosphatase [Jiella flava]
MVASFQTLSMLNGEGDRWPCRMLICGQSEARRFHADIDPTHVLSIVTPGRSYLGPKDVAPDHHLKVAFDDVESPGSPGAPTREIVETIVAWAAGLPASARLCLHGLQGVRRAPAIGLGLLAGAAAPGQAAAALPTFCRHAPTPNLLVVSLFDEVWGLQGGLIDACEARFVPSVATLRRRTESDHGDFAFDMLIGGAERAGHG